MTTRSKNPNSQAGFTIIELMIATVVFSVVLLLCAAGLLQVGRSYYKGVTTARTQEVARAIVDEVSQSIQFGSGTVNALNNNNGSIGYCVSDKTYSYIPNRQLVEAAPNGDQSRHVLAVDDSIGTCSAGIPAQDMLGNPAGRELLTTRMRLSDFTITQLGSNDLYRITVRVVSGEWDLLVDRNNDNQITSADNPVQCKGDRIGTQFCAVSELTTTVQKRVR